MDNLRFDGRVVVVTGAGAGLGRAYALLFGSRGAKVVVNDLGGSKHGDGKNSNAADTVVAEIKSKGGVAVPDYNSVTEGEKIIRTALENFGRIDVLVNNAGILRDKSFASISNSDWDLIQDVHLKGSFKTSQAAWPHFKKQKYGRIIVTSSGSGLYGNFGQANYSAAKMGLVGLCNTMSIEGKRYNINCNVIVPTAASRLTENILPPDLFAELKPELIAPVVVWLSHETCNETGSIIESAAGWATKYLICRGTGSQLRNKFTDMVTPEDVKNRWESVTDLNNTEALGSLQEASLSLMNQLEKMKNPDVSTSKDSSSVLEITDKSCVLYSLGIGASVKNESDLKYLYEGHEEFAAFPTFSIIPGLMAVMSNPGLTEAIPGREYDLSKVLHGEQFLEVVRPLPTSGKVYSDFKLVDVLDKGKHGLIIAESITTSESGEIICRNQMTILVVGGGGFGGKRTSDSLVEPKDHPSRQPDAEIVEKTSVDQAALYRLSGDSNPLHIDPNFALLGGYNRPILHGLCTLGFSTRHVLSKFANNDPSALKTVKVRFTKPVFPGDTLKTEMWQEGNRIYFKTTDIDKKEEVISGAYIDLKEVSMSSESQMTPQTNLLASDAVFQTIKERIEKDVSAAKKINGVFLYHITKGGNIVNSFTLDLKKGEVYTGTPKGNLKPDTTLTIDDKDMVDLALGKLNPQKAFMKGLLKIKGNIMLVQKLKPFLTQDSKL